MEYYILDDKDRPVKATSRREWAKWLNDNKQQRRIGLDEINGVKISTVFLTIDHNFTGYGPPLLFETMIFDGPLDGECERVSTYHEALAMHRKMVRRVKKSEAAT